MSRSAFLSAGGDVLLADFVLSLWNKHWRDEIDTMYVGYNNHAEVSQNTAYTFLSKWEKDPKVRIVYTPHGVGNGTPITQMLLNSKEDALLLLEDDGFIFTPGIVAGWFNLIDDNHVVGSPRYAAGEIAKATEITYDLDYSGVGDKGFGWWPNFFVCKREDLLRTDLDFGSKEYPKGEYFKEFNRTMESTEYTDTFTWASLQLRFLGLTEYTIPQNHAHAYDLQFKDTKEGMFRNGMPKYIHGGSLSSGWNGYLNKKQPPTTTDMEKQDIETRVAFWKIVADVTNDYDSFKNLYKNAIDKLIVGAALSKERVQNKYNLYRNIMQI